MLLVGLLGAMVVQVKEDILFARGLLLTVINPTGPVLIVVGIKKEKEKNSQKGKKRREKKGFLEIYHVVL